MPCPVVVRTLAVLCCSVACASAQSLDDLRQELADSIGTATFARLASGLAHLAMTPDIDAASFRVHDTDGTEFSTLKVPYQTEFEFEDTPGALYLEAGLGYLRADQTSVFELPDAGVDSRVSQKWRMFAGGAGVGWRFPLDWGFSIRPSVGLSISYLENRSDFDEAGAVTLQPLTEGVVYDWHSTALTYDGSLALLYEHAFDQKRHWRVAAQSRFVWTWTDVIEATSRFQDGSGGGRLWLSRVDVFGPTGLKLFGAPLGWDVYANYTWLDDSKDVLGFDRFVEVGLALQADVSDLLPISELRLSGAVITGPDVDGWTFGLGFSF